VSAPSIGSLASTIARSELEKGPFDSKVSRWVRSDERPHGAFKKMPWAQTVTDGVDYQGDLV